MAANDSAKTKAALYCRLSKEDKDKQGVIISESIQNQKDLLRDYAVKNGFEIYHVYWDEDYSGFSQRPGFRQMIEDARGGKFEAIICKHQSRFTRDMEMVERYIHGLFPLWGIRFISLVDNVDTQTPGNKKARQIYGLINEWYSEDLSENIRAVFRKKMEAGEFLGPYAPYGYTKDPDNRHRLIVDDEAAAVVRRIYEMYLQGKGRSVIAKVLTNEGILVPTAYRDVKLGKNVNMSCKWSVGTIGKILKNRVYTGHMVQGKEKKISYKSTKVTAVPENLHIVVENTHYAIVDDESFALVRSIMAAKRKAGGKTDNHPLAGRLRCALCGSAMHKGSKTRDGDSYHLRCNLAQKSRGSECTPHSVRLDYVQRVVAESIGKSFELIDFIEIGEKINNGDCEIIIHLHK